jgi:hypothetical protein
MEAIEVENDWEVWTSHCIIINKISRLQNYNYIDLVTEDWIVLFEGVELEKKCLERSSLCL